MGFSEEFLIEREKYNEKIKMIDNLKLQVKEKFI